MALTAPTTIAVADRPKRSGVGRTLLGFVITLVFVWLFVRRLSWAEIEHALADFDLRWLPVALISLAVGYCARITRWWLMLRPADPSLPWRAAAAPFMISIAVNNVAPLRAGDVLRLFAFRQRSALGAGRVLGTMILERLLDLAALLTIFFVVLPAVPAGHIPPGIVDAAELIAGAGLVVAAGVLLLPALGRRVLARIAATRLGQSGVGARAVALAGDIVGGVLVLGSAGRLAAIGGLTALAWAGEGGVFLAVATAMHVGSQSGAAFALAAATLSTLLPSSPGYVGTFHFFAAAALSAFGASAATAAAFAVVTHLVLWASTTLTGFVVFLSTLGQRRLAHPVSKSPYP